MNKEDKKSAKPEDRLKECLAQRSGLQVFCEWKSELHAFRYYFQESLKEWKYILDVADEDITDAELCKKLESAAWLSRLIQDSGKSVPRFEKAKFSSKSDKWPAAYKPFSVQS